MDLTPVLRAATGLRARQLAALDPVVTQERQLLSLVGRAAGTRFGRAHGFDRVFDVRAYQERVPLRQHADFWRDWWQPTFPVLDDATWPGRIPFFAATSGTTAAASKYIPVSRAMVRCNARAATDVLVHHLAHRPKSCLLAGRNLILGGSTDLQRLAPGVSAGDLSAIATITQPLWVRPFHWPPREIALMADWGEKLARLARDLPTIDLRSLSGGPSWLLLLLEAVRAAHPDRGERLDDFWPNLELVVHGGMSFAPYEERFRRLAGTADLREVYPASEGFFAVADRGSGDGLRLMVDTGLFYEFVPADELTRPDPRRHWLADAEIGVDYALVVTTNAGLWSYIVGDTVRLIERRPARILMTGRTAWTLSVFGEHLSVGEITRAVTEAAAAIGSAVAEFAIGPVWEHEADARGGHVLVVEFERVPPDEARAHFAQAFDRRLLEGNDDYRAHRGDGWGLRAPRVVVAPPGRFAAWMKARGRLGGQNKVPRVILDQELLQGLVKAASAGPD